MNVCMYIYIYIYIYTCMAPGLPCLTLQTAVAFSDPQTCAFPGTELSRKSRSPKTVQPFRVTGINAEGIPGSNSFGAPLRPGHIHPEMLIQTIEILIITIIAINHYYCHYYYYYYYYYYYLNFGSGPTPSTRALGNSEHLSLRVRSAQVRAYDDRAWR